MLISPSVHVLYSFHIPKAYQIILLKLLFHIILGNAMCCVEFIDVEYICQDVHGYNQPVK